jgi:hypothetical protein
LRIEPGVVAFFGSTVWINVAVESPEVGANVDHLFSKAL